MSRTITLRPRLSEKTYSLSEARVYVVDVPKSANKHSVVRAVEEQFEVKIKDVRILNLKGKRKRTMSLSGKRYLNSRGQRSNVKKAYLTLAEGHSLPFFAAVEEEEQKEKATQEKIEKALTKQAEKETRPKRGLRRRTAKQGEEAK